MPSTPMAGQPQWRHLVAVAVALPLVVVAAILAFAWPAGRIGARDLPIGIVGTSPASQQAVLGLDRAQPGGFDFHLYADEAAARTAIAHRDVYGAFVVSPRGITVLDASAASPTVAQLLATAGRQLARHATEQAARSGHPDMVIKAATHDVVPISKDDPRGLVLSSAVLPLTICSILIASAIAVLVGFRPAWRQLVALLTVSAVAAVGVYLIAQGFLGGLPNQHLATWGAIGLTVLAISATTAGLYSLIGTAGLALSAVLMVFVGNPFSGVTSAPDLLPGPVHDLGQWLPPGAGANLLRSTAYFGGNGAAGHLTIILLWVAFGLAAVAVGQHTSTRFAGHADRGSRRAGPPLIPASEPDSLAAVGSGAHEASHNR